MTDQLKTPAESNAPALSVVAGSGIQCDRNTMEDAERYRFLRSQRLSEMLTLFPTDETCDVGLDYAIDEARRARALQLWAEA